MAIQFSRSMRSLQQDGFGPAQVGLGLAIVLVGALIAWLFLARVTLYELSEQLSVSDGKIFAQFSAEGAGRVKIGQKALVRVEGGPEQRSVELSGVVFDLPVERQAEIVLLGAGGAGDALRAGVQARAEVEVEYVTPVELVMRASGKFLNQARLPLSGAGQGQP